MASSRVSFCACSAGGTKGQTTALIRVTLFRELDLVIHAYAHGFHSFFHSSISPSKCLTSAAILF